MQLSIEELHWLAQWQKCISNLWEKAKSTNGRHIRSQLRFRPNHRLSKAIFIEINGKKSNKGIQNYTSMLCTFGENVW